METAGSVTHWIGRLKDGEEAAMAVLVGRYWPYLVNFASKKLADVPRRAHDEEDVVQNAFWAFYKDLKRGLFPDLKNREDFLSILVIITAHKAVSQIEHERAQKRGGGKVRGDSALDMLSRATHIGNGFARDNGRAVTPEEEAILKENYRRFVDELPEEYRAIAELYLAGYAHREITEALGLRLRSVERKMAIILKRWKEMATKDAMV